MAPHGHVDTGASCSLHRFPFLTMKIVIALLVIVKVQSVEADDISKQEPMYFDQLYAQGVKAYTDQLWYKCAYSLENAIKDYKAFKKTLTDCRMKCKRQEHAHPLEDFELPSDLGEFSMFETFLKHADCYRRCKGDAYDQRPGFTLSKTLEATFKARKPYQYLQFCWYKLDRVKQAASASYTFYLANPEDEDVKKNIAFYRDKANVAESEFIDLELVPYKEHYIRSMIAYNNEDWSGVVTHLENSIEEFLVEEERCRTDCEDDVEMNSASHFAGMIADHFVRVLECQLGCERNLSVVYTEPQDNFFPLHFHYLQYAYYKLKKIEESVEATACFLLFHPDDQVVKDNKKVYINKHHYTDDQFVPRQSVQKYVARRQKLQTLFTFLQQNFMQEAPDLIYVTDEDAQSETLSRDSQQNITTDYTTWMERYERLGLHIIAKAVDLHRPFRFAADGLLKQEQCEELLVLMEDIPMDRKGVQIFTLKHGREAALKKDENYEASLRLFVRATEVMRHYSQRYYNLSTSLYFKNTTMVCWHKVPEPDVENDCVPQEFGTCDPESLIRDSTLEDDQFVTVTYLSTMDEGDVFFLAENVTIEASLGVKYGRMIGFQSGDRHGLHIPASSPRCAVVISYTTERTPHEQDYTDTIQTLQQLDQIRMERGLTNQTEVLKHFEEMGVRVTKNGTMLGGGERVLVDGLASEPECASLKNMVLSLGKIDDGYKDKQTPNQKNEVFIGLSLREMSKLMHMGLVNTFSLRAFLDLSEKSRLFVEKYFNLTRPLYHDFTHLVCRSPIDEKRERDDLSHPVHADNCILQSNGSCIRDYPAFVQRDYSALLYLNDDFMGGEFFFAHSNKSEQTSVQPKCGRLVGFNATEYHGVKAVVGGSRCALALWFTMDPNFKELAHVHARKVLNSLQAERDAEQTREEERGGDAEERREERERDTERKDGEKKDGVESKEDRQRDEGMEMEQETNRAGKERDAEEKEKEKDNNKIKEQRRDKIEDMKEHYINGDRNGEEQKTNSDTNTEEMKDEGTNGDRDSEERNKDFNRNRGGENGGTDTQNIDKVSGPPKTHHADAVSMSRIDTHTPNNNDAVQTLSNQQEMSVKGSTDSDSQVKVSSSMEDGENIVETSSNQQEMSEDEIEENERNRKRGSTKNEDDNDDDDENNVDNIKDNDDDNNKDDDDDDDNDDDDEEFEDEKEEL